MTILRIGEIQAREGQGDALLEHLEAFFIPGIESAQGWLSYQILRNQDDPNRIMIIELWENAEAHRASAMSIPPEVVQKVRDLVAGPVSGGYYNIVHENQS